MIDHAKLSKDMHEEADSLVEFYLSDCSCEESTQCDSCKMKGELMYFCINYVRKYQEYAMEKCLKIAEEARDRQLSPHYADSIVREIKIAMGRKVDDA